MCKKLYIDKPPVILIFLIIEYSLGIGRTMNWNELTKADQDRIDVEYNQFIRDIKKRSEVVYVLSKNPGLGNVLETVKTGFEYPDADINRKVLEFNWHAQREINIYFRYGCEIVYFFSKTEDQPMVDKNNFIVPPGLGEFTLPVFFEKFKNGRAPGSYTEKEQKDIFKKVRAYNFLKGKDHFLALFSLRESTNFTISLEHLYFSYYITRIRNDEKLLLKETLIKPEPAKNLIEIGKKFLDDILYMKPGGMPDPRNPPDYDIPFKVYQINPHTFPSFDISNDGHQNKGLLRKINDGFYKFYKGNKFLKTYKYDDYKKMKSLWEKIKKILITTAKKSSSSFKDDEYDIVYNYFNRSFEAISSRGLPGFLMGACELSIVRKGLESEIDDNGKTTYEKEKDFLYRMWMEANETSIGANDEDGEDSIPYIEKPPKPYSPHQIIFENEKEENDALYLFFEAAFQGNTGYLKKIKKYLYDYSYEFRIDLYGYSKLGIENSSIQNDFIETLSVIPDKTTTEFNTKIREEILKPLLAEKIFFYGPEALKKIFTDVFNQSNEEKFLIEFKYKIDESYKAFKKAMNKLSIDADQIMVKNKFQLKQPYKLVIDEKKLPPGMDKIKLRKAINEFYNNNASETGKWLYLLRTCLLRLEYMKNDDHTDFLLREYLATDNKNTIKAYNDRITRFLDEYINDEVLIWKN